MTASKRKSRKPPAVERDRIAELESFIEAWEANRGKPFEVPTCSECGKAMVERDRKGMSPEVAYCGRWFVATCGHQITSVVPSPELIESYRESLKRMKAEREAGRSLFDSAAPK